MNKLIALIAVGAIATFASCSNDKAEDPDPCAYDAAQLKYNGFIKTIINTTCASDGACHGTPQEQDAGGEYLTYAQVKEKIDNGSFRNRVLDLKDMPQGSALSTCDFKKIKDWVDAGAPE